MEPIDPAYLAELERHFELPYGVLAAVIEQESGGNPWASRYEPSFRFRYIGNKPLDQLPGSRTPGANSETERAHRSTSWGPMQIMGEVARELGFTGPFLTQLCEPALGIHYGAQHLGNQIRKTHDLEQALLRYNGGGNPDYGREVMARMRQ